MTEPIEGPASPPIDLAPRYRRPLSLWNPLDYIKLLYWVFWFPQAIRGYVERFGQQEYQDRSGKAFWLALQKDMVQRRLALQSLVLIILVPLVVGWAIGADLYQRLFGYAMGFTFILIGLYKDFPEKIAAGIAFSCLFLPQSKSFPVPTNESLITSPASITIILFVIALVGSVGSRGIDHATHQGNDSITSDAFSVFLAAGIVGSYAGIKMNAVYGLIVGMIIASPMLRPAAWLRCYLFPALPLSRVTPLPLPKARRDLEQQFSRSWERGIDTAIQYLTWSRQFIPVVRAVETALAKAPHTDLLARVAAMIDRPWGWALIRFGTYDLKKILRREAIDGITTHLPRSWRDAWKKFYPAETRQETSARAACAGFWLWHDNEPTLAVTAFARLASIPNGAELHAIAQAIDAAENTRDLEALASWTTKAPSESDYERPLRPGTLYCLAEMAQISRELATFLQTRSRSLRQGAVNRAVGRLQGLRDEGLARCPEPENALLWPITAYWLEIVSRAAGEAGEAALREKVANPFVGYSGRPVRGRAFVGRAGVMERLKRLLATPSPPAIFLYGQRRMGKSSILLNLESLLGTETLLVSLDLQSIGWSDRVNELLFEVARALHHRLAEAGVEAGAEPIQADFANLGDARRSLEDRLAHFATVAPGRRLALAFDEFEIFEREIAEGRLDTRFLEFLRACHQRHPWLALIFAGLHRLEEMNQDYFGPFYGQHEPLRVGYLTREDAFALLSEPDSDFDLDFEEALLEEIYRLTYGQPFLLQRVAWELVEAWNDRFEKSREVIPRTLRLPELEPLLDADFYAAAGYYFEGLWTKNITEDERRLMTVLARREKPWPPAEIPAHTPSGLDLPATLEQLRGHDVLLTDPDGRIRFAAELLRRWVVRAKVPAEAS